MQKPRASIMVVEDNPDDAFLMEAALKKIGLPNLYHLVRDGLEAIAYIKGEGKFSDRNTYPYPTFITTDLKMPNSDGFEVLEFLQNNPERAVFPTVVLTSSRDPDDIRKSYALGASSYHVKPNKFEDLQVLLKALHNYWVTCEVPAVDATGRQLPTDGKGKLGERFTGA